MSETLNVRAVGESVPVEGGGSQIGKDPVKVPNTWYYRRQIADGSLEVVQDDPDVPNPPADSAGPSLDETPSTSNRRTR
ncbi:MAG TPA: hypothetical protein PKY05_03315 [Fibrobacteria bacterium]|nr:hypothetical protein [Fibrobacteria bacterium]